jgi:hypothetical protein
MHSLRFVVLPEERAWSASLHGPHRLAWSASSYFTSDQSQQLLARNCVDPIVVIQYVGSSVVVSSLNVLSKPRPS